MSAVPIPLGDWPDSSERLDVPPHLHDFDAGVPGPGHAQDPGAEALSDHVWLHWCARVDDLLVCAYYHDPMGCFVALVRAGDGRALKGLKIAPPRPAEREDSPRAEGADNIDRRLTWARATAIAAAAELRAGRPPDTAAAEMDAWLRRQLDGLGRKGQA